MMKKWSKNYEKCQNCRSTRFNHIAKGYCTRCYRLVRKLEQVDHWDLSEPQTLKGYPHDMLVHRPDVFKKIKAEVMSQIKDRLVFLKVREEKLAGPIYGIDIEYQLRYIAGRCRTRNKDLFFGIATHIDHNFDMQQKKTLYELLNKIEEDIPWDGINWSKVFLD